MTKPQWLLLVLSIAALPAAVATTQMGCSSNDAATSGAGLMATSPDASTGLNLKWIVLDDELVSGSGNGDGGTSAADAGPPPLAGVTVCVNGDTSIPCVMTDANGVFTIGGLPAIKDITLTLVKAGYRSVAQPVETASTDMDGTPNPLYISKSSLSDPPIGAPIDWTSKGQIAFFVLGPNALTGDGGTNIFGDPGATVTLTPQSGTGPLFLTDQNTFDASATTLIDLQGYAYNVAPGSYTLTVTDPNNDCEPISFPFGGWGYPGGTHQVNFPVLAGFTTSLVGELCTANSVFVLPDAGAPVTDAGSDAGADSSP